MSRRIPRHIIIPAVLFIYACVMAYIGRDAFFDPARKLTYLLTLGAELAILIALFFFLKHRDKLRREREEDQDR